MMGAAPARAAAQVLPPQPRTFEWEYATGVWSSVGGGATPLDYVIVPQIFSLRISPGVRHPLGGGTLSLRPRFSLLLEPIVRGPETYYIGAAAAGDLEWRNPSGKLAVYFSSGGGAGWMDSKGYEIPGAQGQDFNLNWLIDSGVRVRISPAFEWSLGLFFQHVSNDGRDKVNPGLNVLGPLLRFSRRF